MSPSIPNRLFSNEVSGLEVDHRHLDRTVEVRSRLPDTLLLTAGEQPCSNSNPGRSAALQRGRAEHGGGHEAAGRITIEIEGDTGNEICSGDGRIDRYTTARIFQVTLDRAEAIDRRTRDPPNEGA